LKHYGLSGRVRLWCEDEAGFGRINQPRCCWCPKKIRPAVPCQRIRQYNQCFGATEPLTGETSFRIFERCDADSMEIFLEQFSDEYPNDYHILLCDCASWHTSLEMAVPENVLIFNIPPCTPEMNPMEQIWRELRSQGFRNIMFDSLDKAIAHLCRTIRNLDAATVKSIAARQWLLQCFL